MIVAKIKYSCKLCGQKKEWYVMPEKEQTLSKDWIHSPTKFRIVCKKCGQEYSLKFTLKEKK